MKLIPFKSRLSFTWERFQLIFDHNKVIVMTTNDAIKSYTFCHINIATIIQNNSHNYNRWFGI